MSRGVNGECWSVGGLKNWSAGVLECWPPAVDPTAERVLDPKTEGNQRLKDLEWKNKEKAHDTYRKTKG